MFLEMLYFILSPQSMNSNFPINSNLLPSAPKGCIRGRRPLQHTPGWWSPLETSSERALTNRGSAPVLALSWLFLTCFGKAAVSCSDLLQATCKNYSGMSPQGLPFLCRQKSWGLRQEPNNSAFPSKCAWMCLAHLWAQLTWTIRPNTLRRRVHLVLSSY